MRCAVLGDPVDHSLSPVIHRAAYRDLGLDDWEYDAVHVAAGGLSAFVDGLDPACLEIGPGPLLFPNAEKEVPFRVHHPRSPKPPAGDYRLRIRATAPAAYPGESAIVTQMIHVLPYYSHRVRVTSV